ncbi:MAG: plasmid replication initiator TrfA [Candidatus Tectimicrobiota bacterium]
MANQLDLSLLASVSDPELRASLERLGNAMAKAPTQAGPDPKPATTAKIIQFPLFPETTRPVSNDMARSALFSCIQGKDRRFIKDALLATVNGVEIRFTGEQLNQDDHDLLMQLVFMAHKRPIGTWITAPAYAILRALGRKVSGKQYRELRADISRLAAGMVSIRNTQAKIEFIGHHLITQASQHEISRHWMYRLDPALKPLYGDMVHTLIDWNQRMALKGKDLARWVQLYMATHAKPYPVKVDTLRQLSGSRAKALRNFRAQLRLALDALIVNEDIVSWCIEMPDDLLFVNRGKAISSSQRRRLDRIGSRT